MGKLEIGLIILLIRVALLPGCIGRAEPELGQYLNSRPPGPTMPYEDPEFILDAVPERLPFAFNLPEESELLGTFEDEGRDSGTILVVSRQSAEDIFKFYSDRLSESGFIRERDRYRYLVFFPPEGSATAFCGEQDRAVFLEIFDLEDGLYDVRLHYSRDREVIARTPCGQPVQAPAIAVEGFPFPYLAAPPNSVFAGSGGGGGGSRGEFSGFSATATIVTSDSIEAVSDHYHRLMAVEGWTLVDHTSSDSAIESSWDSGHHGARSWLAQLFVSAGEAPGHYWIELRSVSP